MDTRTGQIYSREQVDVMAAEDRAHMKPMLIGPNRKQRLQGKVGRNDPCPCGSQRKFKRCCLLVGTTNNL